LALGLLLTVLPASASEPLNRAIDRLIAAKAGGSLAVRSDDAEFFRRVHLDFSGRIPAAAEVRAFLGNRSADKRSLLIDELLASADFATHWTDRLTAMLLERQNLGKVSEEAWRGFLTRSLNGSPKWDGMVRAMIEASGKGDERAAMKFLGDGDHHRLTEAVGRLFLGMDLKCAKCHDHPSVDEWKQEHYWGLFAHLKPTKAATDTTDKKVYFVEELPSAKVEFQSVFSTAKESTGPRLPGSVEVDIPQFEKGQEFEKPAVDGLPAVPKFRPREILATRLTSADNPYFVRNSVNRIWFLLMGRGLSHPLDEVHSGNPPSHPALMERLGKEFVARRFDLKWLLREIALSESYQRSSRLPEGVKSVEATSYRTAVPKGLTPRQLLHAILVATGNLERVKTLKMPGSAPEASKFDRRGYFTGTNRELPSSLDEIIAVFVETFGQPPGVAEVDFTPGLNQSLFLMNDRLILDWLRPHRDPLVHRGNLAHRLSQLETTRAIAEELYLSVLARFPQVSELREVDDYLRQHETHDETGREAAFGDLAWALLTSTEFRLNH